MSTRIICLFHLALAVCFNTGVKGAGNPYTRIQCSFEQQGLCGWENDAYAVDVTTAWNRVDFLSTVIGSILDPTVTGLGYGPYSDHSGDSYYTAALGLDGAVARLLTPLVQGSRDAPVTVLSFWYHIGSPTANLTVYVVHKDRSRPWKIVWAIPGEGVSLGRGDPWLLARMTLSYPGKFQIAFEAKMNSANTSVYVGIDDVLLQTGQLLQTCDFEGSVYGDLCHFYQVGVAEGSIDDFDWTRQSGETPSLDTGPLFDHTLGEDGKGHYVFMEATRPEEDKTAILYSLEYYKESGASCKLEFFYHAFGADVGELNVWVADTMHTVPLVSEDEWKKYEIDLSSVSGRYRIAFQGVRGNGNLGDIALDDISLVGDSCTAIDVCASSPCLNGGTCIQVEDGFTCECFGRDRQPICEHEVYAETNSTTEIQCSFLLLDLCKWEVEPVENEVTIEWTRESPSIFPVGPSKDQTGDGFFARAIGREGSVARLLTPVAQGSREAPHTVLSFWYHINSVLSNLTVLVVHEDRSRPMEIVWSSPAGLALTRDDPWLKAKMNLNYPAKFQIAFEASIHDTERVYIALDDVLLQTGKLPQSCDFEGSAFGDLCLFYQPSEEAVDDFDWTRLSGETPTAGTGPGFDHTFGENGNGRYMYIEATGLTAGKKAVLSGLEVFKREGIACKLEFYYHALGDDLGDLSVAVSDQVFPVQLTSQDEWKKHEIDLKDVSGRYTIGFEGVRGDGDGGDIAIDDVRLVGDGCIVADICGSFPCLNNGTCTQVGDSYDCSCLLGYPGPNCEAVSEGEPLNPLVIVAISAGCGGALIVILVASFWIWECYRGKTKTIFVQDDASDVSDDLTQLAMSSDGLVTENPNEEKLRKV